MPKAAAASAARHEYNLAKGPKLCTAIYLPGPKPNLSPTAPSLVSSLYTCGAHKAMIFSIAQSLG